MLEKIDFEILHSVDQIEGLRWRDFEWFSKWFLEALGHPHIEVTKKYGELGGDRGIDLKWEENGEKILGQCKRWSPSFRGTFRGTLPVRVVRELGGCMLRDGARRGVFLTTLTYDETARREAEQMHIQLYGKKEIVEVMHTLNPKFRTKPRFRILKSILRTFTGILRLLIFGYKG